MGGGGRAGRSGLRLSGGRLGLNREDGTAGHGNRPLRSPRHHAPGAEAQEARRRIVGQCFVTDWCYIMPGMFFCFFCRVTDGGMPLECTERLHAAQRAAATAAWVKHLGEEGPKGEHRSEGALAAVGPCGLLEVTQPERQAVT